MNENEFPTLSSVYKAKIAFDQAKLYEQKVENRVKYLDLQKLKCINKII
jgi:hypothetical protein